MTEVLGSKGTDDVKVNSPNHADQQVPSTVKLPEPDPLYKINWKCSCFGDLPAGPCGDEFKKAYTCFTFSESKSIGKCSELFESMQSCLEKFIFKEGEVNRVNSEVFRMGTELRSPKYC